MVAGSQLDRGRCELMITEVSIAVPAVPWVRADCQTHSLLIRNATLTTVPIQRATAADHLAVMFSRRYLIHLRYYTAVPGASFNQFVLIHIHLFVLLLQQDSYSLLKLLTE